jgi:hypothetical protein
MQRKTNGGKSRQLTKLPLQRLLYPVEKFRWTPWNYKIPNLRYYKMCNWNGGVPPAVAWHLIKSCFDAVVWGFTRREHCIIINQAVYYKKKQQHRIDVFDPNHLTIFFGRYSPWRTLVSFTIVSAIVKSFSTVKAFYGMGPQPHVQPQHGEQGIPFCLGHHLWPVRHERLYQHLSYRRHSSQDHMTTQAPPLRQSKDLTTSI